LLAWRCNINAGRILVIDTDESVVQEAAVALETAGFDVDWATDAYEGIRKLYETYPDIVIVVREDNGSGKKEDTCIQIRQASYLPIIMLGKQDEAVEMLELGADAYMTKPPSMAELVARVRGLMRRKRHHKPPDDDIGAALSGGSGGEYKEISISGLDDTELRLASCLVFNKGRMLDYFRINPETWATMEINLRKVGDHIRRLRRNLQVGFVNKSLPVVGFSYCS
jgi:DNA-binding response OmpR family regulator